MNTLFIEKFGPSFVALISGVIWWFWGFPLSKSYVKELLTGSLTASAIGAGFMATALSILLTIADTESGAIIKKSNYSKLLYKYIRSSFYGCIFLAVMCLLAFPVISGDGDLNKFFTAFLFCCGVYCLLAFIRVTEILMNIFENSF